MRRAVETVTSSSMTRSQPGADSGAVIHSSTSLAARPDVGAIAVPLAGSVIVKLGVDDALPPGVVHRLVGHCACSHVASPSCAGAPALPVPGATEAPSPQVR